MGEGPIVIPRLLSWIRWLVPGPDRAEWVREWLAEFECAERDRRHAGVPSSTAWKIRRAWAAGRHALWLRGHSLDLGTLGQDVHHGLRVLRHRPGFTLAAVTTLAIGVAGTTVIFSTVRAVLWRPLPYPNPDRLVMLSLIDATSPKPAETNSVSPPNFVDWRQRATAFTAIAAIRDDGYALTGESVAEQITGDAVTGDFFRVMGVPAAVGRALGPPDAASGAPEVVVLSDGLWRRRYGGDPAVVGRRITLDGISREVVGVMPRDFDFPLSSDVWTPLRFTVEDLTTQRGAEYLTVVGRIAASATETKAAAEMASIGQQLAESYPKTNGKTTVAVVPLRRAIVGDVQPALRVLLSAVGLVFLVACVNVASLVMGAGMTRGRDLAVRTALGATRGRVVRGLFVENVILAAIGGACGTAIAAVGVKAVAGAETVGIPLLDGTRIDQAVVAFTIAATTFAAVVFGVLPAVAASRPDGARELSGSGFRTTAGRGASRARDFLVMGEIAMAVALLIGAGLLSRSLISLTAVPLGLDVDHVQTGSISLPDSSYRDPNRRALFVEDVLARLAARGDVDHAAAVFGLPLSPFSYHYSLFDLDGAKPGDRSVELRVVTPGFFATIGTPVVGGRDFAASDRRGSTPVVLVNRSAWRLLWPATEALGHRITLSTRLGLGGDRAGGQVVGVVGDVHDAGPSVAPRPTVYLSQQQFPVDFLTLVVKPRGVRADLAGAIRTAVASADPNVPVYANRTLADVGRRVVAAPRFYVQLVGLFALVAILLAAVGVYGVMAQNVGVRTREIGIRLALGASPGMAVGLMLRQAGALAGLGLAAGFGLAAAGRQMIAGILFGVQPVDGVTYGAVGGATLLVALLASWLPARRAARVDPVATLRAN
jgi:putative ABC transport system permease protein